MHYVYIYICTIYIYIIDVCIICACVLNTIIGPRIDPDVRAHLHKNSYICGPKRHVSFERVILSWN